MPLFDRYLIAQLLRPLGATLAIALLTLLVERSLRVLDLVLGSYGPIQIVFEMLAYLVPHYLGLAVPMALFLAVFLTFNRLSRESEIDAFLSAGIGLQRLLRPVLLMTGVLAVLTYMVFAYVQPYARYHYRALVYGVTNASIETLLPEGVFTTVNDTTFLIEEISRDRQHFGRVFVYTDHPDGSSDVLTARDGELMRGTTEGTSLVRLFDGVRQVTPAPGAAPRDLSARTRSDIGTLRFDELRTSLSEGNYQPFRARGKDERELTLFELWQHRDNPPEGVRPGKIIAEFHSRLVRVISILAMPLLAIPFAMGRRRTQQSYGLGVGVALLIIFNELIEFGESRVAGLHAPPWLGLWLPLVIFFVISLLLFSQAAKGVGRPWALRYFDRTFDWFAMQFHGAARGKAETR